MQRKSSTLYLKKTLFLLIFAKEKADQARLPSLFTERFLISLTQPLEKNLLPLKTEKRSLMIKNNHTML